MSVLYPAVTKYAPASVTKVADDVLRPEIARDLLTISSRPSALKKVAAGRVAEVIAAVRDVELLVRLMDGTDRRVVTRVALGRHPMHERAEHLRVLRDHPWKALSLGEMLEVMNAERGDRGLSRETQLRTVTWCRSLPEERRTEAYRRVLVPDETCRLFIPELVVDVAAGRVPGLELAEIATLAGTPSPTDRPERPRRITRIPGGELNRALRSYPVLDLALAEVVTENGLSVPVQSVDRLTDDAVEHLLRTSSAVELVEQGVIEDLYRLVPVIELLPTETRGRLSRLVTDPTIVAALIDGLTYRVKPNGGDLADLMDRVPDLPFEARLVALSHANSFELRDFFNGRHLNTPRPGEIPAIVDRILLATQDESVERWYHDSLGMTIVILGQCAPSAAVLEGIDRLLDTYPGVAARLLKDEGLVGRRTVERIRHTVGDDATVWEMLLRLAGDWAGTLDELTATARLL